MSKFKVGDRVAVVGTCTGKTFSGETGTIRYISCSGRLIVGVEFDKDISGHGGNGYFKGKKSHCWNVNENMIKTVSGSKTIVIYANGTTTTALLKDGKSVLKTAIAKCSPTDTYDFKTGALIAFDRLCTEISKFPPKEDKPVREVKRPAKVGEYIKIVNPGGCEYDEYQNGDILMVVKPFGNPPRDGRAYYKTQLLKYAGLDEYVVLENYKGGAKNEN